MFKDGDIYGSGRDYSAISFSWLEGHLDQPLSLDNVAAKAGYSKWHLQRMFKDVTGHAIGAYIRARRFVEICCRITPDRPSNP